MNVSEQLILTKSCAIPFAIPGEKDTSRLDHLGFTGWSSGFTMIEAVITIAIVAILAAILVPMISSNIDSARLSRAQSDVSQLAKAIIQFRQDVDRWPVNRNSIRVRLLFGELDNNNDGIPDIGTIPPGWPAIPAANRASLNHELVNNGENIAQGTSTVGAVTWKGPYLTEIRADPWGNPYLVNAEWLGVLANPLPAVYVVSAGPGRPVAVETPYNGGNPPAGSDDIIRRIQ